MSARHSCRQKIFSRFQDSQAYMFVSPSHHFLSQLFLDFLQPNYLSTFLEKWLFSAIMLSRLYDWLNINVLSSWPSSPSFSFFQINSKTFRFCRVGNFYFRQLIQKMFILFGLLFVSNGLNKTLPRLFRKFDFGPVYDLFLLSFRIFSRALRALVGLAFSIFCPVVNNFFKIFFGKSWDFGP